MTEHEQISQCLETIVRSDEQLKEIRDLYARLTCEYDILDALPALSSPKAEIALFMHSLFYQKVMAHPEWRRLHENLAMLPPPPSVIYINGLRSAAIQGSSGSEKNTCCFEDLYDETEDFRDILEEEKNKTGENFAQMNEELSGFLEALTANTPGVQNESDPLIPSGKVAGENNETALKEMKSALPGEPLEDEGYNRIAIIDNSETVLPDESQEKVNSCLGEEFDPVVEYKRRKAFEKSGSLPLSMQSEESEHDDDAIVNDEALQAYRQRREELKREREEREKAVYIDGKANREALENTEAEEPQETVYYYQGVRCSKEEYEARIARERTLAEGEEASWPDDILERFAIKNKE